MNKYEALTASEGSAVGPIHIIQSHSPDLELAKISHEQINEEIARYLSAAQDYELELQILLKKLKGTASEIIQAQALILQDEQIKEEIVSRIKKEQHSAAHAVHHTYSKYIERLRDSASNMFKQRIIDLVTIRERLVDWVVGESHQKQVPTGSIVLAKELSPTDVVSLVDSNIKGIVLEKGGLTAHAAIVAQSLEIPCLVQAGRFLDYSSLDGVGILDGAEGIFITNPDEPTIQHYEYITELAKKERQRIKPSTSPVQTKDGTCISLHANIEFLQELDLAKKIRAEGIGLVRTEALLYGGTTHKSVKEQDVYYRRLLEDSTGPVVIRLFDVGGDKLHVLTPDESNPFLGWRGIRMLLDEHDMLHSQLRAILKCAGDYPSRIKILAPMVTNVDEIARLKEEVEKVQDELVLAGHPIDSEIPIGIMVEVPAVAIMASTFAKEADFFSIGTNDLTQYTLAVDRTNDQVGGLFQHDHPAIWLLIRDIVTAAKTHDIEVSVCGELASDLLGASALIGLGLRELSMNPSSLLKVKDWIREFDMITFEAFAKDTCKARDRNEVYKAFRNHFHNA
ncbi:MAG: phosphoenolpyruvate--protein phosphotransferase [Bacteroidota bacterium]|nr:phosphoenolpyruvate--protein phosphotransferase [Bacteroidota bacterium]